MPAKAGIQDFKKLNKIKYWIPAFVGMTALFPQYDTVSEGGGEGGGDFFWLWPCRAVPSATDILSIF
jgi:hypothetical protein